MQKNATAVYLYDITNHIKSLQLGSKLYSQQKQNKSLTLSQMTLSHEFRAPLGSTLMLLESLLRTIVDEAQRRIIGIVISQINLLICLVNDILDIKMLQKGKFMTKNQAFSIIETINFIKNVFAQ